VSLQSIFIVLNCAKSLTFFGLVFRVHPSAKVMLKMKYSSTIQTLKNSLLGVHVHHQANDDSDLSERELVDKVSKNN
jgi:hypothetical protein